MEFDDILVKLGEFGKYQKILYFLICLPGTSCGMVMVLSALLLGEPDYRCKIPGFPGDTFEIQNHEHELLIQSYIPPSTTKRLTYDGCNIYAFNQTAVTYGNGSSTINATKLQCSEWVYDQSVFVETFLSKHNLICGDESKASTAKTLFFVGVLVGAFVFGYMSDYFGRKLTLYTSFLLILGSTLGAAFSPNYAAFVSLRFLAGAAASGVFVTCFVIGMELIGPSKRVFAGIIIEYFFALGLILLALIGYLVKRWDYVELITACPMVLYLSYWWLLPESPRWLMSRGRFDEAEAILQKAARINKVDLPKDILNREKEEKKSENVLQLFTSRVLLIRTLIIFFNWMVVAMTYYGLSLNTGNLGGNFYLNFFISGLVEFPAYTITLLLLDRLGRKKLHCASMVVGGVACLCTIFTALYGGDDLQAVTTTLAMIGKLGSAAGFAIIYVYAAELYPTTVRNAGMGFSSCAARVGAMVAPQIADSAKKVGGDIGQVVPLIVFGAASVAAGLLTLFLPETLNKNLPETIEDGKLYTTTRYQQPKSKVFENGGFVSDENVETKM